VEWNNYNKDKWEVEGDDVMEEIFFKWIPTVGFPIVVAAFVLIRIEPKLTKLTEAIIALVPIVKESNKIAKDIEESLVDFRIEVGKINGKK